MFFATGSDLLPVTAPGGTGTFKLYGLKDNLSGLPRRSRSPRASRPSPTPAASTNGERPSTSPSVAGDIVFYTTTTENAATPCADFNANLYALTYAGGAAYDSNATARSTTTRARSPRRSAGRATAPFIVDQHLYFGTTGANGAHLEAFGDPEDFNNGIGQVGVRILSWREIR